MSTIFLDRDGVINKNQADYVKTWREFQFLDGVCEAIAKLTQANHRVVVCTNQAGVARRLITVETIEDIHRRLMAEVEQAGGKIEKIYYCPHGHHDNCACRKPRPGMLLRARDELGINLNDAVFIGDSITDMRAGFAAGVRAILVLTGLGFDQFRYHYHEANGPFRIAWNLKHAVDIFLEGSHVTTAMPTPLERACYSMLDKATYQDVYAERSGLASELIPIYAKA